VYDEPAFDPVPSPPAEPPPPGTCDCQVHIFHPDRDRYPLASERVYHLPAGTVEEAQRMHRALGVDRGVLVQASLYGTDNRLLADSLAGRPNYRGIAIVDDSVDDDELYRLHRAGVRGARFNFSPILGLAPTNDEFRRTIRRIAELGWHARINAAGDGLLDIGELLRDVPCPVVIDHMAHVQFTRGVNQPVFALALDLLANENVWIMLSGADRRSGQGRPWSDTVAFGRRFIEAAPGRAIWSTDWPHVKYGKPMVNDGALLELLYSYAPEPAVRRAVLVDNPARLMGFAAVAA
jgi:predicted TIM-barrel fold metal-dependent hydrolase